MHSLLGRGKVRLAVASWLLTTAACGTGSSAVTTAANLPPPGSSQPGQHTAASESLESVEGEFFVTCGSQPIALAASGGDNAAPAGFVEQPAQVRAGARRGGQVESAISSSLGLVNAWLPLDRLGWYTTEATQLTGAPVFVTAGQRLCRRDGGSLEAPRVYVETRLEGTWTAHEHPARVDAATEGALAWVGTLPRTSLAHIRHPVQGAAHP